MKTKIMILIFIVLIIGTACIPQIEIPIKRNEQTIETDSELVVITRIIDGDTFELEDKRKVRILGIDYPDISKDRINKWFEMGLYEENIKKCYYEGIDMLNRDIVNKTVLIKRDNGEMDKDRYDRLLRYVEVDKTDISAKLISYGYAIMYDPTSPKCYNCVWYEELEKSVRDKKEGCLWS